MPALFLATLFLYAAWPWLPFSRAAVPAALSFVIFFFLLRYTGKRSS